MLVVVNRQRRGVERGDQAVGDDGGRRSGAGRRSGVGAGGGDDAGGVGSVLTISANEVRTPPAHATLAWSPTFAVAVERVRRRRSSR